MPRCLPSWAGRGGRVVDPERRAQAAAVAAEELQRLLGAPLRRAVWERAALAASVAGVTVEALQAEAALQRTGAVPAAGAGRAVVTEWVQWPSWRRLVAIARAPVARSAAATGGLAASSLAELVERPRGVRPRGLPGGGAEHRRGVAGALRRRGPAGLAGQHRLPDPGCRAGGPGRRTAPGGAAHGGLGRDPRPGGRRADRGGRHRADPRRLGVGAGAAGARRRDPQVLRLLPRHPPRGGGRRTGRRPRRRRAGGGGGPRRPGLRDPARRRPGHRGGRRPGARGG